MNKFILSFLIVALISSTYADDITGGWTSVNSNNLDSWTQEALIASIQRVEYLYSTKSPVFQEIQSIQSQIVAGINYKFVLKFDVGVFEVTTVRLLDGSVEVSQIVLLQTLGVPGGWSQLDSNNLDQFAEEAANMAISNVKGLLQSSNGQFSSIEFAQSQVVAGINYKFHLQFFAGDGGRIHYEVVVWRQLSGTYVVTSAQEAN